MLIKQKGELILGYLRSISWSIQKLPLSQSSRDAACSPWSVKVGFSSPEVITTTDTQHQKGRGRKGLLNFRQDLFNTSCIIHSQFFLENSSFLSSAVAVLCTTTFLRAVPLPPIRTWAWSLANFSWFMHLVNLKQGGSSNTSTRQEQDGCLSRDRCLIL